MGLTAYNRRRREALAKAKKLAEQAMVSPVSETISVSEKKQYEIKNTSNKQTGVKSVSKETSDIEKKQDEIKKTPAENISKKNVISAKEKTTEKDELF